MPSLVGSEMCIRDSVLGARVGVFLEPLPANWRIQRVTQAQTISLVYEEHQRLPQRKYRYVFGFTQTLVRRLLAVPSFSFCCCHADLFTCILLQLPRCTMGLLPSASTTNCCWASGSVGACCVRQRPVSSVAASSTAADLPCAWYAAAGYPSCPSPTLTTVRVHYIVLRILIFVHIYSYR